MGMSPTVATAFPTENASSTPAQSAAAASFAVLQAQLGGEVVDVGEHRLRQSGFLLGKILGKSQGEADPVGDQELGLATRLFGALLLTACRSLFGGLAQGALEVCEITQRGVEGGLVGGAHKAQAYNNLDQAFFGEGQGPTPPDHQVIEHPHIDQLQAAFERLGEQLVGP